METEQALVKISDLHYRPRDTSDYVLKGVNLEIKRGDFCLLLGPSGCGKSTLTRCFNGLIPHLDEGELTGQVLVEGKDTRTHEIHEFASKVGMVFQNPDDQILSLRVVDEVAWGVENLGLSHDEVMQRVDSYMALLEISHLKERLTFAISGGQKQKVSIASNLAMLQDVLVLDDPTTDLDPICKAEVTRALDRLHKESGKTLIVIEHDLNDLVELANRMIVMEDGRVAFDDAPEELFSNHYDDMVRLGVNIPQHVEIAHVLRQCDNRRDRIPVLRQDAFRALEQFVQENPPPPLPTRVAPPVGEVLIKVEKVDYAYQSAVPVLRDVSFEVRQGEFVAIIGANGSGKSTLVNILIGLLRPDKGKVVIDGHDTRTIDVATLARNIGYAFQNPDQQLFTNTVREEVGFSLRTRQTPQAEVARLVDETLEIVGLTECQERHPFSLSRGQRQKLAVATALVHQPRIMLLDEPTTGQDRRSLKGLLDMMARLNRQGNTTVMITHDMDIVAGYATRVIVMAGGRIVLDGRPEDVFYDHFDELSKLSLRPPTVIDFCRRLQDKGLPRFMTTERLGQYLVLANTRSPVVAGAAS